jgi:hypothetical protein
MTEFPKFLNHAEQRPRIVQNHSEQAQLERQGFFAAVPPAVEPSKKAPPVIAK